jgi:hypothetical protein
LIGLLLEVILLHVDLFFQFGIRFYTRTPTGCRIPPSTATCIVTCSYLITTVFSDVDVAYRYVPLLYPSTAGLRAA